MCDNCRVWDWRTDTYFESATLDALQDLRNAHEEADEARSEARSERDERRFLEKRVRDLEGELDKAHAMIKEVRDLCARVGMIGG